MGGGVGGGRRKKLAGSLGGGGEREKRDKRQETRDKRRRGKWIYCVRPQYRNKHFASHTKGEKRGERGSCFPRAPGSIVGAGRGSVRVCVRVCVCVRVPLLRPSTSARCRHRPIALTGSALRALLLRGLNAAKAFWTPLGPPRAERATIHMYDDDDDVVVSTSAARGATESGQALASLAGVVARVSCRSTFHHGVCWR